MSLGFTTLPNFVHVKLEMCQGRGPSIKNVGIVFDVFYTPRYFDPDITNFYLLISCNIGILDPLPPKIFRCLLWMAPKKQKK